MIGEIHMKAIIYFSLSKEKNSKRIANEIDGDHYELINEGRQIKWVPLQMFYYGFKTVAKKKVKIGVPKIDFDKYDEIVLVSPVWAGRVCAFMKQYLTETVFKNKSVTILGTSKGGYDNYFRSFDNIIHESNKVIEEIMYVKGSIVFERKA
jgi:hypothetical protein